MTNRFLALALIALLPLPAVAASVGRAHVMSRLGEPLRVEVEVSGLTDSQRLAGCYDLQATLPNAAPIAGLREAPVELVDRAGGTRVVFRTRTAVGEPLIRLQLRAGCGIELVRSFDLLLPLADAAVEAVDTVVLPSEPLVAPAPPTARRSPAPRAKAEPSEASVLPQASAVRGVSPPAAPTVVPSPVISDPAQQAVLAAAAQLAAAKTEAERAAIVARLQQTLVPDAKTPAAPAVPAGAGQVAPASPAPTTEEAPIPIAPRQIPQVTEVQPAVRTPPTLADDGMPIWWIFAVGLAATLGYWFWHRRRLADAEDAASAPAPIVAAERLGPVAAPASAVVVTSEAGNIFRDPAAVAAAAGADLDGPASVSPLQERLAMRSTHPDFDPDMPMPQVEQFDEEAEVIELAELMLQFGRVSGAVDTLRSYLDEAPKAALLPWLRLLDIYRQANQRAEFEDAARHLNRHFNVQVVSWEQANADAASAAAAPQTLEGYPRALQGIVDAWGTPAGLEHLNELLRDNRDGARVGFPPEVAKEILFLTSVLKETLTGSASPAGVHGEVAA